MLFSVLLVVPAAVGLIRPRHASGGVRQDESDRRPLEKLCDCEREQQVLQGNCGEFRGTIAKIRTANDTFKMAVRRKQHDAMSHAILVDGAWEVRSPEDIARLGNADPSSVLPPSDGVFLDVGANQGYFSFLFASYGYRVYAVEPMTQNRRAIATTMCANHASHPEWRRQITVFATAVAASEMTCMLIAGIATQGNGYMECTGIRNYGRDLVYSAHERPRRCSELSAAQVGRCEEVPARPLDAILAEARISRVDVAKVDIEGFECEAFRGGKSLFKKLRPRLILVEAQHPGVLNCTHRLARRHGYAVSAKAGAWGNVVLVRRD